MSNVLLHAKSIQKTYGRSGFKLKPIDIQLKAGEITGLVGENGNGKTTLLRILAGLSQQDTGTVDYLFSGEKSWRLLKPQIGYISQSINKWVGSVYENLHYSAALRGIKGSENEKLVNHVIKELGLWEFRFHQWSELSGGYQMRFELAKILVQKPRLLILDEPLANLDIKAQTTFLGDIKRFQQNSEVSMAVIVSSQHLYKIEEVADNLIFLRQGECFFNDSIVRIRENSENHVYEIITDENPESIETWVKSLGNAKMIREGKTYLIYTNKELGSSAFLTLFIQTGFSLLSYRDISGSTRQLFENHA